LLSVVEPTNYIQCYTANERILDLNADLVKDNPQGLVLFEDRRVSNLFTIGSNLPGENEF